MVSQNRPARFHLLDVIHENAAAIQAQATQQFTVITDNNGDPVFVTGWLKTVTGIAAYGAASKKSGTWQQL